MSARKTGIVYVDVGWKHLLDERDERHYGIPPSRGHEPEVSACWNVRNAEDVDDTLGEADFVMADFDDVDEAIAWARERASLVLVRLGPTEASIYSAGERRATRELLEFGGTDLTPHPEWPPSDWPNTSVPPLPPAKVSGHISAVIRDESAHGGDTPEEAARGDIPERYARPLSTEYSEDGTQAIVLLATNEPPAIEYYEVHCELEDGRWFAVSGGNASGPTGEHPWSA